MKAYWLNHYFPKMMAASIAQMPAFDNVEQAVKDAGMQIVGVEKYFISDGLKDLFLYSGKNKPEIYLDEKIRNGISSFAALANQGEIAAGVQKLQDDITSGHHSFVKNEFDNILGDYLFIIIENI